MTYDNLSATFSAGKNLCSEFRKPAELHIESCQTSRMWYEAARCENKNANKRQSVLYYSRL